MVQFNTESKRSSICSFIMQQGLKRKRRPEELEECNKRPKKNVVIQIIEKVVTKIKRKQQHRPPQAFVFEELPAIEWTNGDLGVFTDNKVQDEDSIFCLDTFEYMEFPKPPVIKRQVMKRVDSCPFKFESLLIIKEENTSDDEDSTLPVTPKTSNACISKELLSQMENLYIEN